MRRFSIGAREASGHIRILVALTLALAARGQTLDALARSFADHPSPQGRAALLGFASAHTKDEKGALALLAVGSSDLNAGRNAEALTNLETATRRLPTIADHAGYLAAKAAYEIGDDQTVVRLLQRVWDQDKPASPYAGNAAMLAARSLERTGQARRAVELLQSKYEFLPQPAGDLALAIAFEAAGDSLPAVGRFQSVYYGYPLAPEAADAGQALSKWRVQMGDRYPPVMPGVALSRAVKLLDAGRAADAKRELQDLLPQLTGTDRDFAALRIGVSDYRDRNNKPALTYLQGLAIENGDVDAERLFWIVQCARRLDDVGQIQSALSALESRYPKSQWRVQALVSAGDYHLLANRYQQYEPLYQTCFESFPNDARASYCHWKVAFSRYIRRDPRAAGLLREHVRLYPQSDKAPAALYFLGRLAEAASDFGSARAWYDEVDSKYLNTYYQLLARDRLKQAAVAHAPRAEAVTTFLNSIAFPPRIRRDNFQPNAETQRRMGRARLLTSAGLDQAAETELRFGARYEGQPQVYALELARSAERRSAYAQGIRYIKAHAPGYLLYPMDAAPAEFWRLAFPMPYRDALVRSAQAYSLDPYIVAALARQESEFDPLVISHANAYGLTQILPSTGRELARRILKSRRFRATMLFQPDVNLRLGTAYLRQLLNSLNNSPEAALASYNAGRTRAAAWLGWADFREPAEYVEIIPIGETRNYVQIVLRNAAIYRALYSKLPSGAMNAK